MGGDGTLGLSAIKELGGLTLVQDPASAKFSSMPSTAIEAGLADYITAPGDLPVKLIAYQGHLPRISKAGQTLSAKELGALEKIIIPLRASSGQDFTLYRRNTFHRRVMRRISIHQTGKAEDYVRYLQEKPREPGILYKELLIGVTNFFRDPAEC